ncbi:MAG TPA: DUF2059 domain-containing protein [Thermoanaerobaculia bacterium]|nr:DUF2059 domain-containing protein [Thermoanaerobaculia bacterium]
MKSAVVLVVLLSCLCPLAAWSEEAQSSHKKAALELIAITEMESSLAAQAEAMVNLQVEQNPLIEPYRDVLLKWIKKTLTWEAMAPQMTQLFMDTFTEAELRDLIAFYRTPTGKKALTQLPVLFEQGAKIGQELAEKNEAELEAMIEARSKELEKKDETPE